MNNKGLQKPLILKKEKKNNFIGLKENNIDNVFLLFAAMEDLDTLAVLHFNNQL